MADSTDLTYARESVALVPSPESDDPDVIRRQIEHTRAQLANTMSEIGERLSPETLIEQAKASAREATVGRIKDMTHEANRKMEGMSHGLSHTIRENPLPVAVIGLGLGWLLLSDRGKRADYDYRADQYRYRAEGDFYYNDQNQDRVVDRATGRVSDAADAVGQKATQVKNRVSDTAHNVGESVSETAHRVGNSVSETVYRAGESVGNTAEMVQERAGDTAMRAGDAAMRARQEAERLAGEAQWRSRQTMTRTKQSFWSTMEENPLVIGAVLAIAGAAVGAAIPASEYENRLMGETRDRLVDEAKVRAQDAVERVQTVVEETQKAAVAEAKDSAQRQNLTADTMIGNAENNY